MSMRRPRPPKPLPYVLGGPDLPTGGLVTRRIYISVPGDDHLKPEEKDLKWGVS